jgi:phage pi2 protein 07
MKNKSQDWPHEILKHLFKEYSGFDVYINSFLQPHLNIPEDDSNLRRKVVRTLQELEKRQLITWSYTDHKNEQIEMSDDYHDNTTVNLNKYRFHVRLTFDGLVYIGNYLRLKKQDTFTIISLSTLALTGIFVLMSAYYSSKSVTSEDIHRSDITFQNLIKSVDSLKQSQAEHLQKIQKAISLSGDSVTPK